MWVLALASQALLLPLSASFQSRPESAKDGVMLLNVKASGGDEIGEPLHNGGSSQEMTQANV